MTLPSPKLTVEGIGTKGVAQAAEADLLALVFLLEGSLLGGLVVERRILLAVLLALPDYQMVFVDEQVPWVLHLLP